MVQISSSYRRKPSEKNQDDVPYWKNLSEKSHDGVPYLIKLAVAADSTEDDLIREMFLQPEEKPLKYSFPGREKQKLRTVWRIVSNLPATFSVLKKKSRLAKGTLSKYLKKLEEIQVVMKEIDLYRLKDGLERERNGKKEILWRAIVNRWYIILPEYQISKGRIYHEPMRGRKELHPQAFVSDSARSLRRKRERKKMEKIQKIKKKLLES